MEHRQFGRSGLRVTALSLGAMTFGEAQGFMKGVGSDDAEARRVLDAALDAGIDTVGTANTYSEGRPRAQLGLPLQLHRCSRAVLKSSSPRHRTATGFPSRVAGA